MDPVIYDGFGDSGIDHVEYCFQVSFGKLVLVVSDTHLHTFVTINIVHYNAHTCMHAHSLPDYYLLIMC